MLLYNRNSAMEYIVTTKSDEETIDEGKKLLRRALKKSKENEPLIFCLEGELGSGKTHFIKGIAEELGLNNVKSPTFILMRKFMIVSSIPDHLKKNKKFFFHIDCYRISDSQDAKQISLDKVIQSPRAIVAIEWAEKIRDIIPKPYWRLKFEYINESERRIAIGKVE